jgi:hypothetical protein
MKREHAQGVSSAGAPEDGGLRELLAESLWGRMFLADMAASGPGL